MIVCLLLGFGSNCSQQVFSLPELKVSSFRQCRETPELPGPFLLQRTDKTVLLGLATCVFIVFEFIHPSVLSIHV